jgi:hypothetical protein
MMYGYVIDHDWAHERACARYGPAKTEDKEDQFETRYTLTLSGICARVWRRTRLRCVETDKVLSSCVSLAENTSESAMKLPPREVINKIKLALETEEEPAWYRVYCWRCSLTEGVMTDVCPRTTWACHLIP